MANISVGELIAMASFLRQKRRSEKQQQSSQEPHKAKSVPVKGWGGGGKRSSGGSDAPRQRGLAKISSRPRGGSTTGASKQITGQQKIEYMKKGLAAQEESAQRIRSAALEDMLDYQRTREGDVRSWPISEGQTMMNDLMALMVEQGRGQAGKSNLPTFVEPMGQSGLQKMDLLKS